VRARPVPSRAQASLTLVEEEEVAAAEAEAQAERRPSMCCPSGSRSGARSVQRGSARSGPLARSRAVPKHVRQGALWFALLLNVSAVVASYAVNGRASTHNVWVLFGGGLGAMATAACKSSLFREDHMRGPMI
jgi:hypothetical protein